MFSYAIICLSMHERMSTFMSILIVQMVFMFFCFWKHQKMNCSMWQNRNQSQVQNNLIFFPLDWMEHVTLSSILRWRKVNPNWSRKIKLLEMKFCKIYRHAVNERRKKEHQMHPYRSDDKVSPFTEITNSQFSSVLWVFGDCA